MKKPILGFSSFQRGAWHLSEDFSQTGSLPGTGSLEMTCLPDQSKKVY